MRIDPRFAALATAAQPRTRETGGPRFSLAEEIPAGPAGARAAAPLATLDAILALQAEEDPRQRRRRAARSGGEMLDALDALKAALLAGRVAPHTLAGIAGRLSALAATGDPELDAILAAIDLRARVELAKLGRAA